MSVHVLLHQLRFQPMNACCVAVVVLIRRACVCVCVCVSTSRRVDVC